MAATVSVAPVGDTPGGEARPAQTATPAATETSAPTPTPVLNAQQLSKRVAHLEADLALISRRKAELEQENEVLAGTASRQQELEAALERAAASKASVEAELANEVAARQRVEAELASVRASRDSLEAECRKHREDSSRRRDLEAQQAAIASAFNDLQGVVAQLVQRLTTLDLQRAQLAEEKKAAEAAAADLRAQLQKWRSSHTGGGARAKSNTSTRVAGNPGGVYRSSSNSGVSTPQRGCRGASGVRPQRCQVPRSSSSEALRNARAVSGSQPPEAVAPQAWQTASDLQLAESVMQCAILRQHLDAEHLAAVEAEHSRDASVRDAASAERQARALQSELKDILANWSARGAGSDDED